MRFCIVLWLYHIATNFIFHSSSIFLSPYISFSSSFVSLSFAYHINAIWMPMLFFFHTVFLFCKTKKNCILLLEYSRVCLWPDFLSFHIFFRNFLFGLYSIFFYSIFKQVKTINIRTHNNNNNNRLTMA